MSGRRKPSSTADIVDLALEQDLEALAGSSSARRARSRRGSRSSKQLDIDGSDDWFFQEKPGCADASPACAPGGGHGSPPATSDYLGADGADAGVDASELQDFLREMMDDDQGPAAADDDGSDGGELIFNYYQWRCRAMTRWRCDEHGFHDSMACPFHA
jgi:hypothetical protein